MTFILILHDIYQAELWAVLAKKSRCRVKGIVNGGLDGRLPLLHLNFNQDSITNLDTGVFILPEESYQVLWSTRLTYNDSWTARSAWRCATVMVISTNTALPWGFYISPFSRVCWCRNSNSCGNRNLYSAPSTKCQHTLASSIHLCNCELHIV